MAKPTDTARWLTAVEQHTWRQLMGLILELQAEQEEALVGTHGITEGEYGVLVALSEADDRRLRMCDLAQTLRLSPSGLTRRIDGLAKQGYVTREPSADDRRVMLAVRSSLIDHLSGDDIRILGDVLDRARASRDRS